MSYIGVDLDGTLAVHEPGDTVDHVGEPIPSMLARVKGWLAAGDQVRIITARVAERYADAHVQRRMIHDWCREHIGVVLTVQSHKCGSMTALWDDRAVEVIRNTGIPAVEAAEDTVVGKILTWLDLETGPDRVTDPTARAAFEFVKRSLATGAWK